MDDLDARELPSREEYREWLWDAYKMDDGVNFDDNQNGECDEQKR